MKLPTSKFMKLFASMFRNKVKIERKDRTFLLIGTHGSDIDVFADVIVDDLDHWTTLGREDKKVRIVRKTIPGISRKVALIVAPGLDTDDREDEVIEKVRKQLRKSRRNDPHVDHILFFPQDPLNVHPKPAENRSQLLASLCRETGDSAVHTKITLILKDEAAEGRPLPICKSWDPYMDKGIGSEIFIDTKDAACTILRAVIERGRA